MSALVSRGRSIRHIKRPNTRCRRDARPKFGGVPANSRQAGPLAEPANWTGVGTRL